MINRNALTIRFKQPFLDWIAKVDEPFEEKGNDDYTIYLIPEVEGEAELEEVILDNWLTIFEEELVHWTQNKKLWPPDISYEMFREWVSIEYTSLIHDLGYNEIDDPEFNSKESLVDPSEKRIFEKIISGGQTGADQGALDAALSLNHPCGGWCPKGRKSESGRIPDKYPLQEHASASYPARTEANVKDSDGTLIFTYGKPSGGTALTVDLAKKHNKPVYIFDFNQEAINPDPAEFFEWGANNNVFTLNVAGPRESGKPGTQDLVESVMVQVLEFARGAYPVVE